MEQHGRTGRWDWDSGSGVAGASKSAWDCAWEHGSFRNWCMWRALRACFAFNSGTLGIAVPSA